MFGPVPLWPPWNHGGIKRARFSAKQFENREPRSGAQTLSPRVAGNPHLQGAPCLKAAGFQPLLKLRPAPERLTASNRDSNGSTLTYDHHQPPAPAHARIKQI